MFKWLFRLAVVGLVWSYRKEISEWVSSAKEKVVDALESAGTTE